MVERPNYTRNPGTRHLWLTDRLEPGMMHLPQVGWEIAV